MTLGNILLLAFQSREFAASVLHVPLSGPLLGMALLLLALVLWGGPSPGLQDTTRPLLASLAPSHRAGRRRRDRPSRPPRAAWAGHPEPRPSAGLSSPSSRPPARCFS